MQVAVADAGLLRKQVTLTIPADEVRAREDQLLEQYSGRVNLKGFRAGKVPKAVVRKRFGEAAKGEAQEALVREAFEQALRDNDLQPVGPLAPEQPNTDDGVVQVIAFDVAPAIELPEPDSITLEAAGEPASDEEIQSEIDSLCQRMGEQQDLEADASLQADDILTLTGAITAGDETVREVHDLHHIVGAYPLFGTEGEQVVELVSDKHAGDALTFTTTLPENFRPEEWAGKEAEVSVTIQKAQRQVAAELDDELAKRIGAESVEQLRERIAESVNNRKNDQVHGEQIEELVGKLIDSTSFDLPEQLVTTMIDERTAAMLSQRQAEDADAEINEDEIRSEAGQEVDRGVRRQLLMDAIANAYDVQTTQQDLQQQIALAAYQSGRKPEDVAKQLQESGRIGEVANDIRQHKALELFLSKVLGDEAEADEPEAAAAAEE